MSNEEDEGLSGLFGKEASPEPEPTSTVDYTRPNGQVVHVSLVGKHPLWGHLLYPSSKALSRWLENDPDLVRGKCVAELGAGGGLPGLTAALLGAEATVISDFNEPVLIENLAHNIATNCASIPGRASAVGYTWSANATPLLSQLPAGRDCFDVMLLADLVFNNSQHVNLLKACEACLQGKGFALCFYGLHRPKKADADQAIFAKAEARGWKCEQIFKDEAAGAMFPGDEGDLLTRSTVYGWLMRPPSEPVQLDSD